MKYRIRYSMANNETCLRVSSMYATRAGNLREAKGDEMVPNDVDISEEGRKIKASAIRRLRSSVRKFIRKRGRSMTYKTAKAIYDEGLRRQGLRIVT